MPSMRPFWSRFVLSVALSTYLCNCNSSQSNSGSESTGGNATGSTTTGNSNTTVTQDIPVLEPKCSTTQTASVNITVVTAKGPLGGSPQTVDNNLYSMNIDDKNPEGYSTTLDSNFVNFLKALKPALLRWPTGHNGQQYQFSTDGSSVNGFMGLTPTFIDQFMQLCNAVGAKPMLAVNLAGTTAKAQELVTYVNKTKSYNVTWWQLGNEPDLNGWTDDSNPTTYAAKCQSFMSAIKSVDSSAKFAGVEVMTGADIMGTYSSNNPDWATPILTALKSTPVDAIAWHYYPMDSSQTNPNSSAVPTVAHVLQETATDWPPAGMDFATTVMPKLRQLRDTYAPSAQIWIDEIAEDSGKANGEGTGDLVVGALWAADIIGRYAEQGATGMFKFIFKGGEEHFYTLIDSNNAPRPEYYPYWMYAQQWGDSVVQATSDNITQVAAHASIRTSDKSLRIMVVNKTTTAQNVRLKLSDYTPSAAAQYQMVGQSLQGTSVTLNGNTLTGTNITQGNAAISMQATTNACTDNVIQLPALSATMLLFAAK